MILLISSLFNDFSDADRLGFESDPLLLLHAKLSNEINLDELLLLESINKEHRNYSSLLFLFSSSIFISQMNPLSAISDHELTLGGLLILNLLTND